MCKILIFKEIWTCGDIHGHAADVWGSRGREFKSRQPDQTIHSIRPSRTCIQPTFLPPSMTPSGGRSNARLTRSFVSNGVAALSLWDYVRDDEQ